MGVVKTFLLPPYGFSFGYKRKGVSIAPLTKAQRKIVGHKYALSKATVMRTRILSVTPINPLGVTAPSSEGAEAATAAEHGGYLGEDRGAENAFNSPLWQHPIKMCAHGAHSFVFHAPEGRASCAEGALHVPKARLMCRRHASFAARMCRHSLVSSGSKREWRYRKSRQSGSENTAVHTACGAITV